MNYKKIKLKLSNFRNNPRAFRHFFDDVFICTIVCAFTPMALTVGLLLFPTMNAAAKNPRNPLLVVLVLLQLLLLALPVFCAGASFGLLSGCLIAGYNLLTKTYINNDERAKALFTLLPDSNTDENEIANDKENTSGKPYEKLNELEQAEFLNHVQAFEHQRKQSVCYKTAAIFLKLFHYANDDYHPTQEELTLDRIRQYCNADIWLAKKKYLYHDGEAKYVKIYHELNDINLHRPVIPLKKKSELRFFSTLNKSLERQLIDEKNKNTVTFKFL